MRDPIELKLTQQDLDQLQRLRASIVAFQNLISPLPADQRNNDYNEQFNQLRGRVEGLLQAPNVGNRISPVITEETLVGVKNNRQAQLLTLLMAGMIIFTAGVALNALATDELIVWVSCGTSGFGVMLMGLFALFRMLLIRRKISNMGEIYQKCTALLYQVEHALNMAIPNWGNRPPSNAIPKQPAALELLLDSLHKQKQDWEQKLQAMEAQRMTYQPSVPMTVALNLDFIQRELAKVNEQIAQLIGHSSTTPAATMHAPQPTPQPQRSSNQTEPPPTIAPAQLSASQSASDTKEVRRVSPPPQPEVDATRHHHYTMPMSETSPIVEGEIVDDRKRDHS